MSAPQLPNCSCDGSMIELYLSSQTTLEQQQTLEMHLNDCQACREKIQAQAAQEDFWIAAQTNLETRLDLKRDYVFHGDIDALISAAQASIATDFSLGLSAKPAESPTECIRAIEKLLLNYLAPSQDDSLNSLGRMGTYEILEIVGRGGMGIVVKAYDTELKRIVAIKTMLQQLSSSNNSVDRLAREAQAAASLRHHHIVSIFRIDRWQDLPFIVMPFIKDGTLECYVRNHELSIEEILQIGIQICDGLTAAHAQGIVHRDIKPSNILLQDGIKHLLISDFGLARAEGDQTLTLSGTLAGTPQFMSPEQAQGKSLDYRTDLFSFGSLLYWLCTKKYPFDSTTSYGTIFKIANDSYTSASIVNPSLPQWLSTLIDKLLEKNLECRLGDAREVSAIMQQCLDHERNPAEYELPSILSSDQTSHLRQSMAAKLRPIVLNWVAASLGLMLLLGTSAPRDSASDVAQASFTQVVPTKQYFKHGPLDVEELIRLNGDIGAGRNLDYWLHRLAFLPVADIPASVIPVVIELSNHPDSNLRNHALAILSKDPFQVVSIEASNHSIAATDTDDDTAASKDSRDEPVELAEVENPFIEIDPESN